MLAVTVLHAVGLDCLICFQVALAPGVQPPRRRRKRRVTAFLFALQNRFTQLYQEVLRVILSFPGATRRRLFRFTNPLLLVIIFLVIIFRSQVPLAPGVQPPGRRRKGRVCTLDLPLPSENGTT